MSFRFPPIPKLVRSALICIGAVASVLSLQYLFPDHDFTVLQTTVLTVVSAWIINFAQEAKK